MPRLSTSPHSADHRLVKGLNEGDESALAALYDGYGERLYDYALSMSGDEKAAADIVHDTFIDACRRAPRMRDHLYLGSWLYGAARRRCVRRGRPKVLFWDRDGEFSDAPFLERAEPDDPLSDPPPAEELHTLLGAALARLEPADQEVLFLAVRHGLRPDRLGATLGLSSRRAAARVRSGRAALDAAFGLEVRAAERACAGEPPRDEVPDAPGGRRPRRRRDTGPATDPATAEHVAGCPDCRRRGALEAAALLRRAPAPVLPAALRHRVMHTATDPELAGYRTDIAARGGPLTPSGMPSQPDVPSPFTRRWLLTGGGMAGALAAALAAVFVMGPGVGNGTLSWPPFKTHPQPSITETTPPDVRSGGGTDPSPAPGGAAPGTPSRPALSPQPSEKTTEPPKDPATQPPEPSPPPETPGVLVVNPAKVELGGKKTAEVDLVAESGPVTWTAATSTNKLVLSETQGGMVEGETMRVTLTLRTVLIGLPGEGTLTFTDSEGVPHQVKVVWGASLL